MIIRTPFPEEKEKQNTISQLCCLLSLRRYNEKEVTLGQMQCWVTDKPSAQTQGVPPERCMFFWQVLMPLKNWLEAPGCSTQTSCGVQWKQLCVDCVEILCVFRFPPGGTYGLTIAAHLGWCCYTRQQFFAAQTRARIIIDQLGCRLCKATAA